MSCARSSAACRQNTTTPTEERAYALRWRPEHFLFQVVTATASTTVLTSNMQWQTKDAAKAKDRWE
jgi:hypothetical protein